MSNGTPIDKIVEAGLDKVLRRTKGGDYWTPTEVLREVLGSGPLATIMGDLAKRYGATVPDGPWGIDKIVLRYVKATIGTAHRVRDSATGLREYESYAVPGQSEHRYMRLSGMTAANLQAAMEQTRTQERQYALKGEGYHILLEELQKAGATATVGDVMNTALPRIVAFRAKSA